MFNIIYSPYTFKFLFVHVLQITKYTYTLGTFAMYKGTGLKLLIKVYVIKKLKSIV